MTRHTIYGLSIVLAAVFFVSDPLLAADNSAEPEKRIETGVPCQSITQGPKSHWFSYYDKLQFDATDRYVLGMEVDFDDRPPTADDVLRLGMVDLKSGNKWIEFGESRSWGWQQGCMLQWLPGRGDTVIYNDCQNGQYVCVVQNVFDGTKRILPRPVYAVSPDGKMGVSLNFARLNETRPGYGYTGVDDPGSNRNHPDNDGIFAVDMETGKSQLIVSLSQIASFKANPTMTESKHWFNHLLFNTDGTRFIFLHRWVHEKSWFTRMFTAQPDGENVYLVADHDMVSHFIWRDPTHILAWSNEPDTGARFHLYEDRTENKSVIGEGFFTRDGHCTYSPDRKWMMTDTYPDSERMQNLMLFRLSDSKLVKLGRFYMSQQFNGQTRCDLHPRWSRDGTKICIDSLHAGQRQMYLLDIGDIIGQH